MATSNYQGNVVLEVPNFITVYIHVGHVVRKPVFGVADQVLHKATEAG